MPCAVLNSGESAIPTRSVVSRQYMRIRTSIEIDPAAFEAMRPPNDTRTPEMSHGIVSPPSARASSRV